LTVWALNREVIENAAVLRAGYRLQLLDAIHVACAVAHRAQCFLTNDERLRRIQELPILILADHVRATP